VYRDRTNSDDADCMVFSNWLPKNNVTVEREKMMEWKIKQKGRSHQRSQPLHTKDDDVETDRQESHLAGWLLVWWSQNANRAFFTFLVVEDGADPPTSTRVDHHEQEASFSLVFRRIDHLRIADVPISSRLVGGKMEFRLSSSSSAATIEGDFNFRVMILHPHPQKTVSVAHPHPPPENQPEPYRTVHQD